MASCIPLSLRSVTTLPQVSLGGNMCATLLLRMPLMRYQQLNRALSLLDWMVRHGVDKTLVAIGGDSTNVNTGIDGGTFQFLEQLLDRNLIWLVCGLHLNELYLRHLITGLDGKTCSDTGFTGEVFSLKV